MRKLWIAGFVVFIGLAGWTKLADAELFSATGPVIAILAGELFVGEAKGHLGGSGTITVHAQANPDVACLGQFAYDANRTGSGQFQCNDGTAATFQFQRLSLLQGYGIGSSSRGSISFTYGLAADEAEPYLKLPLGKKLRHNGKNLELVDL